MGEPATETETKLTEEDIVRALCLEAQQNDEFNGESVKAALDAVDLLSVWNEASDDNEYTDEESFKRALNSICVAAKDNESFDSDALYEELDGEGMVEVWDEVQAGNEEEDEDEEDDAEEDDDEGTDDPDETTAE